MGADIVSTTIHYRKHGTQPPVFVAGTFSDPPWQPQEMTCTAGQDAENDFHHDIHVTSESKVEYKFRIGTGDWWVLSEDAPTVTDEHGNLNNLLKAPKALDTPVHDHEMKEPSLAVNEYPTHNSQTMRTPASTVNGKSEVGPKETNVAQAEIMEGNHTSLEIPSHTATSGSLASPTTSALMESPETYVSRSAIKEHLTKDDALDMPGVTSDENRVGLFSHECAGLYEDDEIPGGSAPEQDHRGLLGAPSATEHDMSDPTLEPFPTDKVDIMSTVRRVSTGLNEDQTDPRSVSPTATRDSPIHAAEPASSPKALRPPPMLELPKSASRGSISEHSTSSLSLGSIHEDEEEEDEEASAGNAGENTALAAAIAPLVEQESTAEGISKVVSTAGGEIEPSHFAKHASHTPTRGNTQQPEDEGIGMASDDEVNDRTPYPSSPKILIQSATIDSAAETPKPRELPPLSEPALAATEIPSTATREMEDASGGISSTSAPILEDKVVETASYLVPAKDVTGSSKTIQDDDVPSMPGHFSKDSPGAPLNLGLGRKLIISAVGTVVVAWLFWKLP